MAGLLLFGGGCERLFGPAVPVSVASPDGRFVASVRNHPTVDPPEQSLWLKSRGGEDRMVRRLGGDADWCHTIVWSADGSTVAYLVQDARLVTVDAVTGSIVSEKWLTAWRGEYPPYRLVRGLALSVDGREAVFRDYPRRPRRTQNGFDKAFDVRTVVR